MNPQPIGPYTPLAPLGRGSTGQVFRARGHGREVALKLYPASAGPADALRFEERCRTLGRLQHAGLGVLLDFGVALDGTRYMAWELVEGVDLATQLIAEGPWPALAVCRAAGQLARALAAVHAQGFVHRDVKAANTLLRADGTLVLVDFDFLAPLGELADGQLVTGTPAYMAPEVITGGVLTAATDLYALGCLVTELLTGRPPFSGSAGEVLQQQWQVPAPPLVAPVPAELAQLVAHLLRKPPHERPDGAAEVARAFEALAGVASVEVGPAARIGLTDRLIGREAELGGLRGALDDVLAGVGRAVVVSAPAGIGKSRLVQELALTARLQGVAVAYARCQEDGAEPFQALRQAFEPLLQHAPLSADLALALPQAGEPTGPAATRKQRLHAALVATLVDATRDAPLLIVLDDVQWGDPASLEAFNACVRGTTNERVLWLWTLRPDEAPAGHAARHALEEGFASLLSLAPLERSNADMLLAALLGTRSLGESFERWIYEATGGNAFFIVETLRHLAEEGVLASGPAGWRLTRPLERLDLPEAAEAAVLRRVANLAPAAAGLLRLATVLGPLAGREVLARASGLATEAFLTGIEQLVARDFLVSGTDGYRLPHDRIREAVYGATPAGERRALHQACGEALEGLQPEPTPAEVAALAYHFARAGDVERGYRYGLLLGNQARAVAPARALAAWQQADALLESVQEVSERRQMLWWALGAHGFELRPDWAIAALERLLAVLPANSDRGLEAEAFLATALGFAGQPNAGLAAAERALARAAGASAPLQAAALMVRGPSLLAAGHIDALVETARAAGQVLQALEPTDHSPLIAATRVGTLSYPLAVAYQGEHAPAGVLEKALAAAEAAGAVNLLLTIRHYSALRAALAGLLDETQRYLDWAAAFCRQTGAPPHPWLLYFAALLPFQKGDMPQAQAAIARARALPHFALAGTIRHQLDILAGRVATCMGDFALAGQTLEAARAEASARGLLWGEGQALLGLAELALASEEPLRARAFADQAAGLAATGPGRNPLLEALAWRLAAEAALAEGAPMMALEGLGRALARHAPTALDMPLERARLYRLTGEARLALGEEAAAVVAWRLALAEARAIGHLPEASLAEARLDQAVAKAAALEERWAYLALTRPI